MFDNKHQFRTTVIIVLILFCQAHTGAGQPKTKWRLKSRIQASYEYDDNIREAAPDSNRLEDSSARFIFESSASRSSINYLLALGYKGGLQTYLTYSFENKLINEVHGTASLKFGRFTFGLRSNARLKIYLGSIWDYSSGSVAAFIRPPTVFSLRNEFVLRRGGLDYQRFSNFDYSTWQVQWTVTKKLASRLALKTSVSLVQLDYKRQKCEQSFDGLGHQFSGRQKDKDLQLQTQVSYTKKILLNLEYLFQRRNSNSDGSTFYKHQIRLFFGVQLPKRVWFRGFAAVQLKKYTGENTCSVSIEPDPESTEGKESNFFVFDLSKDVSAHLTSLIRYAYYNNESVIRGRFYRKYLLTFGFDYRL